MGLRGLAHTSEDGNGHAVYSMEIEFSYGLSA